MPAKASRRGTVRLQPCGWSDHVCRPWHRTILLPTIGYGGVCWTYAALYVLAFILTLFIRPQQPGFDSHGHRIKKSAAPSRKSRPKPRKMRLPSPDPVHVGRLPHGRPTL